MNTFEANTRPLLNLDYSLVEVYDAGTGGDNEVAWVRLADDSDVVMKIMLSNKKYHQRRKALTEVVMYLIDSMLGPGRVVPDLFADIYQSHPVYERHWGKQNAEGARRVCRVIRRHAPGTPGDEWRGAMYAKLRNLDAADEFCRQVIAHHPDAERISVLDFLCINQDRSARNWVTEAGVRFYAIDNGMAWFHEFPANDDWKIGCAIDDVLLQKEPWQFISGVFTTSWAGRPLSSQLQRALDTFDEDRFLALVDEAARQLRFPAGLSEDWRFEGILRRLRWMSLACRQPTAEEYREWHRGSVLFTPPEICATGGLMVWQPDWDTD